MMLLVIKNKLKCYELPDWLLILDLQNVSRVLPTSCMGFYDGKPLQGVVYCLQNLAISVLNV